MRHQELRCETCYFYQDELCHRYPTPVDVNPADWCGEHQQDLSGLAMEGGGRLPTESLEEIIDLEVFEEEEENP